MKNCTWITGGICFSFICQSVLSLLFYEKHCLIPRNDWNVPLEKYDERCGPLKQNEINLWIVRYHGKGFFIILQRRSSRQFSSTLLVFIRQERHRRFGWMTSTFHFFTKFFSSLQKPQGKSFLDRKQLSNMYIRKRIYCGYVCVFQEVPTCRTVLGQLK